VEGEADGDHDAAVWRHPPGYRGGSPWEAFLVAYTLLAILSVLYVRSAPRSARARLMRHYAGHDVKSDANLQFERTRYQRQWR
jgi:hypothetical protein